jgi:hypothetical protein
MQHNNDLTERLPTGYFYSEGISLEVVDDVVTHDTLYLYIVYIPFSNNVTIIFYANSNTYVEELMAQPAGCSFRLFALVF